ncbi:SDR family NAD(P)-dependent oxidoreductase [Amorphus sp. 3PC139-8]|uniref:SDR family NAD(P)-dependent oxidoreductase n=1 Tax=Amorphus sp. 3PC139-8 TaxID=2735676 RepID=UPI00345D6B29
MDGTTGLLAGKTVLITGAGQGNGRSIALGMAEAGARLALVDLDEDACHETLRLAGVQDGFAARLDIADREACRTLSARIGEDVGDIDCLVNNAGILLRGAFDKEGGPEAFDRTISVNVTGAYNMVHAFLEPLTRNRGSIINIGSIQSFVATPNSAAYTTSKGAILQFTKALAAELARREIRVNGIAPGVIRTPMTVATLGNQRAREALLQHIPLRRPGEPGELAGPAVFLASDLASYVTGVMLPVDGGYLAV